MIVTRKKPVEQVLAMLRGVRRVALVGCGNCATACQTGGEKELEQMRQLLQEQGAGTEKQVLRSVGTTLPSQGSTVELRHALGLDAEGIAQAVREVLA